jgi:hypothetical protein
MIISKGDALQQGALEAPKTVEHTSIISASAVLSQRCPLLSLIKFGVGDRCGGGRTDGGGGAKFTMTPPLKPEDAEKYHRAHYG